VTSLNNNKQNERKKENTGLIALNFLLNYYSKVQGSSRRFVHVDENCWLAGSLTTLSLFSPVRLNLQASIFGNITIGTRADIQMFRFSFSRDVFGFQLLKQLKGHSLDFKFLHFQVTH
jgi:hypothetical protein